MAAQTVQVGSDESVVFPERKVIDRLVFLYFKGLPKEDRLTEYDRALRIGCYALLEDRIGAFLNSTEERLGLEFEYLKLLYDKRQASMATASKGSIAEDFLERRLIEEAARLGFQDQIRRTGDTAGSLSNEKGINKTGDIIIEVGGPSGPRIVIESKLSSKINEGSIEEPNHANKKSDTVWSQLVEAAANRDASFSILLLDSGSTGGPLATNVDPIKWYPGAGLAVKVNVEKDDLQPLFNSYAILRSLLIGQARPDISRDALHAVVKRAIGEVKRIQALKENIAAIRNSAQAMTKTLAQSESALHQILETLSVASSDPSPNQRDLLELYLGDPVREAISRLDQQE